MLEICVLGRFLEDYFYYYSKQIISTVAKESLIPYNLIQNTPETQTFNALTPNATLNQIKKYAKYGSVFKTKYFVTRKYTQ